MSQINPLNNNDLSPLIQKLGRHADANKDGHVSGQEFAQFLDQVLHPDQPSTQPMTLSAPYKDRLVGFDVAPSTSPSASLKARAAAIAQYLAPSADNLRQLARELGPGGGLLSADGSSLTLSGGEGTIGVRERGDSPVWQLIGRE